jgi:uncharacterized membrane protein YphA (DoxX/SURF4 family)
MAVSIAMRLLDRGLIGDRAMQWKTASRIFFALTMIAIGLIGLIGSGFAPIWLPVAETTPGRQGLAYLCILVSLACGAGLLVKRSMDPAALALLIYLLIWTGVFKLPFILRAPLEEVAYQSTGENIVLIAAAWVLYVDSAKDGRFPGGSSGLRTAYLLYGLALIAFGLSHFFYLNMTEPLVPRWLPQPVFWAYLTGTLYLAAGLALAAGIQARTAAVLAAVQITLITLLVWGPMVLSEPMNPKHWQEAVVSWALTAGAWVLATGSPPATALPRLLFPSRQSA